MFLWWFTVSSPLSRFLYRMIIVHLNPFVSNCFAHLRNILLASSKAVLSDLGIAAFVKDEEAMQKRVGSPGYLALSKVIFNFRTRL